MLTTNSAGKSLTIVIPTYNRKVLLGRAIQAYLAQSAPEAIQEILIVDDGSTDDTAAMVAAIAPQAPFPIRYLKQANKGPAAARNLGIREARSSIILFTDSDIVPGRELVAQHFSWHQQHSEPTVAVLGYVTWPSEPKPTPFMRWYGEHRLFAFGMFRHGQEVRTADLYTCNVSLKTDFLRSYGQFDEEFKTAACEDIELGYRLGKSGLKLLYNSQAIGYHHQFLSFADASRKALANADAVRLFLQKEAGKCTLDAKIRRRSHPRFQVVTWTAITAATVLAPARPLLDSYIPLPHFVYRLFSWYDSNESGLRRGWKKSYDLGSFAL